jgi:hypothetical protein
MELTIEREMITRPVVADRKGQTDLERKSNERLDSERFRRSVAGFHALKKSPEAADPESPAAQEVRRMNRELWNELGRPRKKRKRE